MIMTSDRSLVSAQLGLRSHWSLHNPGLWIREILGASAVGLAVGVDGSPCVLGLPRRYSGIGGSAISAVPGLGAPSCETSVSFCSASLPVSECVQCFDHFDLLHTAIHGAKRLMASSHSCPSGGPESQPASVRDQPVGLRRLSW